MSGHHPWPPPSKKPLDLRAVEALRNKGGSIPPGDYLTAAEVDCLAEYVDKLLAHSRALRAAAERVVGETARNHHKMWPDPGIHRCEMCDLAAVLAQAKDA